MDIGRLLWLRDVGYNLVSGTSLLCIDVAGFAALMRNIHTDWSPVAIRFAMTTTSMSLDHNNRPIYNSNFQQLGTQLDFSAGHISPQLATDHGLIFDIDGTEYIDFLCTLNYSACNSTKLWEGK
ncbi:Subtilisin-like protease SBT1.5 [Camellia lanceoleosa]|uniref:Subtilisin-like protease SBT1.5 n=1 Tax=Camellia lanceoleosa TaxID=1840588 RepID=A0ACC0IM45_9ERIC|nr:Subtilisin-like protease SBT1.5 [Camellia lanceoleosa]